MLRSRGSLGGIALGSALIALGVVQLALADYTPPSNTPGYTTVGSGGAKVIDYSDLDAADAVASWNWWTSKSKLSTAANMTGCGSTTSCIVYVNESSTLPGTNCTVPDLPSGTYGTAYQIWNGQNIGDSDCATLSSSYPVFVISLNVSLNLLTPYPNSYLHIQRHELGHAIGLGDAPTATCWSEWGYWLPVMNNGTQKATYCPTYPNNFTASYNEALYAVIRSGW